MSISSDDFNQTLKCEICNDLLYKPMTLLCQHTFCYHCLELGKTMKTLKECPLCKLKLEIPDSSPQNNLITEIEKIIYGNEHFKSIETRVNQEQLHRKLEPIVRQEIQEAFKKTILKTKKEDYKNININLNQQSEPVNNNQQPLNLTPISNDEWTTKDITRVMETLVFIFYAYNYFNKIIPLLGGNKIKLCVYFGFFLAGLYLIYKYYKIKEIHHENRNLHSYSFSYIMPLNNDNLTNVNSLSQSIINSMENII